MAADFEARFGIESVKELEKTLKQLGGKLILEYEYTDHYFRPSNHHWKNKVQTIRLRQHFFPPKQSEIFYSKTKMEKVGKLSFKRSLYPVPKLKLAEGDYQFCLGVLKDLGFRKWFSIVKKNGKYYDLVDCRISFERIRGLGWMGQLEIMSEDASQVAERLEGLIGKLGIERRELSFEPMSLFYARRKSLI